MNEDEDLNGKWSKLQGMFKGLKSKLEDGAKKAAANVQAAASQYGEQLSQQFRDISANAVSNTTFKY